MLTGLVSELLPASESGLVISAFEENAESIFVSSMFISSVLVLSESLLTEPLSRVLTWTTFSLSDTYFWFLADSKLFSNRLLASVIPC